LPKKANELYNELKKELTVFYDTSGSIGRRYARMDEVGTPYCITIDYQTLEDNTVTIRDRDTAKQIRISAGKIMPFLTTVSGKSHTL
jgi:glycyl-tRNA synthetase